MKMSSLWLPFATFKKIKYGFRIQSMEKDLGPLIFLRKSMSGYVYSELREFDMQLTVARRSEGSVCI